MRKSSVLQSLARDLERRSTAIPFSGFLDARIVNCCYNSTDPHVGLKLYEERPSFKCYMADTGLLVTQSFSDTRVTSNELYRDILFGKLEVNEGMLVENVVAQQLRASGHRLFFYSRASRENASERMEIDFLTVAGYPNAAMRSRVSPIEVKSRSRYKTVSLDKFKAKFGSRVGIEYVLHPKELRVEGDRRFLPLYMSWCFVKSLLGCVLVQGGMGMDIQQLRHVVQTAQMGSFQKAADALFITRAALSKSISQLEGEIGYPLFERPAHGCEAYRAGKGALQAHGAVGGRLRPVECRHASRASDVRDKHLHPQLVARAFLGFDQSVLRRACS